MSLKAGYKGIKNSLAVGMSAFMQKFANALVIKSIGSGLSFSEAGDLSANVKTIGTGLTLSEAGQLSADSQIINYTSTEQATGEKYFGDDVYTKTIQFEGLLSNDQRVVACGFDDVSIVNKIWIAEGSVFNTSTGAAHPLNFKDFSWAEIVKSTDILVAITAATGQNVYNDGFVKIKYTKNAVSPDTVSQNTRKKGGNK